MACVLRLYAVVVLVFLKADTVLLLFFLLSQQPLHLFIDFLLDKVPHREPTFVAALTLLTLCNCRLCQQFLD